MARGDEAFNVRMPDGLRDRIKAAADRNGRSMNAEMVHTLQAAYPGLTADKIDALRTYLEIAQRHDDFAPAKAMASEIDNIIAHDTALTDSEFQTLLVRCLQVLDQAMARLKFDEKGQRQKP